MRAFYLLRMGREDHIFPSLLLAAPRAEHVFIISIDGGNPEVMLRSPMPVLPFRTPASSLADVKALVDWRLTRAA